MAQRGIIRNVRQGNLSSTTIAISSSRQESLFSVRPPKQKQWKASKQYSDRYLEQKPKTWHRNEHSTRTCTATVCFNVFIAWTSSHRKKLTRWEGSVITLQEDAVSQACASRLQAILLSESWVTERFNRLKQLIAISRPVMLSARRDSSSNGTRVVNDVNRTPEILERETTVFQTQQTRTIYNVYNYMTDFKHKSHLWNACAAHEEAEESNASRVILLQNRKWIFQNSPKLMYVYTEHGSLWNACVQTCHKHNGNRSGLFRVTLVYSGSSCAYL